MKWGIKRWRGDHMSIRLIRNGGKESEMRIECKSRVVISWKDTVGKTDN